MDEVLQQALEQDSSVQHTITDQAGEMAALAQQSTADAASAAETIQAFDRITPESTPARDTGHDDLPETAMALS